MTSLERPPADLTAGIPTHDSPNPLEVEINRPWQEQQEAQRQQLATWQLANGKKLDAALIDPTSLEYDFSKTSNPDTARKKGLVAAYLSYQNQGQPIPGDHLGASVHRDRIAQARFDGRGKGDDIAFFKEIQNEAVQRKQTLDLADSTRTTATKSTFAQFFDPIRSGKDAPDWTSTLEEIRKSPGYQPGSDFRYREIWNSVREDIAETTASHRPQFIKLFNAISSDDDNAAYTTAKETYTSFETPEDRSGFINTLTSIANTLPEDRRATFLNNLTRQSSRDLTDIGRNIVRIEGSGKDLTTFGDFIEIEGVTKTGAQLRAEFAVGKKDRDAAKDFADDIQQIRRRNFAPVTKTWGEGTMGDIEMGIYSAPGAIATTVAAAVPYVGQVLTYKMMEGAAYTEVRQSLMADGVSEELATSTSKGLAGPIGAIQFIPERIGVAAVTRRIPGMEKAFGALSNKISSKILRGAIISASVGAVELSTEIFQNRIPGLAQDVASHFDTRIPGNDWQAEIDGAWSEVVSTSVAILPLAIFGGAGGLSNEARARAFSEVSPVARAAYGITPEDNARIDAAALEGQDSLNDAVTSALENRDPHSQSAIDAVQEIATSLDDIRNAAQAPEASGIFPTIVFDSQTRLFTLYDQETGEEIGQAVAPPEAIRLAAAHSESVDLDHADRVAYLASTMQAAFVSGRDDAGTDRQTLTEFRLGETLTAAQASSQSPENAARVASQTRSREISEGGDGSITDIVFGQSSTDPTSLARGMRRTVNRIYQGASVLTVFHEETHGFWKEALASGRLTRTDATSLLKAIDTFGATVKTRSGKATNLLPADFATLSAADQEVAIDEGISELMEAEILRTRKSSRNLPPGLISKNLSAIARLASEKNVGKFRSFIHAIRQYFGLALDRATILRKGLESGEINPETYNGFLNSLHGLSEQVDFDQMARDAESSILDGLAEPGSTSGDPFSLGQDPFADPSRLARQIEPLKITSESLPGGKSDWHRAVRDFISENLKGQTLTNLDSGREITFTGLSTREAGSKLRKPEAFRASLQIGEITQQAIHLGQTPATEKKSAGYRSVEYFAFPVEIDGDLHTAWFNALTPEQGSSVFYEFGLWQKKRPGLPKEAGQQENPQTTSFKSEPAENLAQFLDQVKEQMPPSLIEKLPAPSFSIGPARLADLLRDDAQSRIKNPEVRHKALTRIARNLEAVRIEAEKLELAIGSKRLRKSLQREAAVRQAMRFEELENQALARHSGILSDEDLTILTAQPVHSHVVTDYTDSKGRKRKRGVLMSRTAAAKKHPDMFTRDSPGEYDGADGMSPVIFGGSQAPDQLAQSLYDEGIISDPYPDTMWDALRAEQNTVSTMREALQSAKDDLRAARTQSQSEAKAWLKEQIGEQEINFSPKQEILRASAMLDAILSALPADLRGQIGGYTPLARLGSDETRLAFLRERLARADRLLEKWLRRKLDKEFRALMDRARPQRDTPGERPKGKIGSDVHELFASLRDAMSYNSTETEAEALRLETLAGDPDLSPEQQSHLTLEANLTRLVGDWNKADAARMDAALNEAERIYQRGYGEHRLLNMRKAERRSNARHALKTSTGKRGDRPERVAAAITEATRRNLPKQFLASLLSFNQILESAFGRASIEARSLVDWERRASNAKHDALTNKQILVEQLFADLAGGKYLGEKLRWDMSQPGKITVKDGFGKDQSFSELQAITATMMWRQEDGRRHMEGHQDENAKHVGEWHWTEESMDAIEDSLSENAKAVRLHLTEQYGREYDRLNAVFRELNGVSLPRHKHYSPISVKPVQTNSGQIEDPTTGFAMSGMSPGSLKNRSTAAIAEPDFRDALQTYLSHSSQMEHWMAYAPFAVEAQALVNSREVGNAVEARTGAEGLKVLRSHLDFFAQGGNRDASAQLGANRIINRMLGRAASVALVGRVSVLVIQSTQLLAGIAQMPTGAFVTRFAKLHTGQLQWGAALKSDFIRRRLEQMPPVVRQAMDGLTSSKPSRLKYAVAAMGQTISGADALFTAGTYAIIYDYQLSLALKDGLTGADATARAHIEAERSTERVAQPTRPGTRSLYENTASNPFVRLTWAFASEARQKVALAAFSFSKGKTASERARALFVTYIVGGVVASLIRSAMRDIRSDEDDEWFDERNWDPTRIALSSITGPLQGIPVFGDIIEAGIFKTAREYLPEGNLFSGAARVPSALANVPSWFTGERDFEDALKDAEDILSGAGLFTPSGAAGASLSHVVRDAFNIIDNFNGD